MIQDVSEKKSGAIFLHRFQTDQPTHLSIAASQPIPVTTQNSTNHVDQPVQWCLDTLHSNYTRYGGRPYGGMLTNNIDRKSSLFY